MFRTIFTPRSGLQPVGLSAASQLCYVLQYMFEHYLFHTIYTELVWLALSADQVND